MKLTSEEIDAARTPGGGWTKKQLAAWGVGWPPPKGWRKALLAGVPIGHAAPASKTKRAKSVRIDGGKGCPKCKTAMQRYEHSPQWVPAPKQASYFRYWDYCNTCNRMQLYEAARVIVASPEGAS